jgi:hypothetical protein
MISFISHPSKKVRPAQPEPKRFARGGDAQKAGVGCPGAFVKSGSPDDCDERGAKAKPDKGIQERMSDRPSLYLFDIGVKVSRERLDLGVDVCKQNFCFVCDVHVILLMMVR